MSALWRENRINSKTAFIRYGMKAAFFRRYLICISGILMAISLFFSSMVAKWQASGNGQIVYFLTVRSDSVRASAGWISLQGGAGYVLSDGVALDVYFSLADAEKAMDRVLVEQEGLSVDEYVFSTDMPAAFVGCLRAVKGCIRALEDGASQSSVQEILEKQADMMVYLSQECDVLAIGAAAKSLRCITQETIYANHLRYFLCETCESIAKRR